MAYWFGGAQREEIAHRREVEEIIDFLEIQHVRKASAGTCPMDCASGWNWRGRWR